MLFTLVQATSFAQEQQKEKKEKQESREAAKERHKKFWKKVGNDQRDFWKGEHEKHVAKQEAKKARKARQKNEADAKEKK